MHIPFHRLLVHLLIDEIHTEEMQYQAPEHKIRKRPRTSSGQRSYDAARTKGDGRAGRERTKKNSPLMTDGPKFPFILRVRLDAQTGREDELAHRGAEAGEEGVEGLLMCTEDVSMSIHSFSA